MKKLISILLCCLLLSGCGANQNTAKPEDQTSVPETSAETEIQTESSIETEASTLTVHVYVANDNVDAVISQDAQISELTAEALVGALIQAQVLPTGVEVRSFETEEDNLFLDLSQSFADAATSTGTAGELMLMAGLTNTFLEAYEAQTLTLTVEGKTLETGHMIYDAPLTFYE